MNLQVIEWKIENISCWRKDVHVKSIQSPVFFFLHYTHVDLYPRGVSGCRKRMAVGLYAKYSWTSGEVSFIGPDGSLLCSPQKVDGTAGYSVLEDGPEFDQVVAPKGQDQLILRFCFENYDFVQRMGTTINVSRVSLKIDPKLIESVESENEEWDQLELRTVRANGTTKLLLRPKDRCSDNILVESRVSLLKSDNSLVRHGRREHIFRDSELWTFSDSLNVEELVEKDITILVDLKIVNGRISNSYNHLLYQSKGVTVEPVTSNRSDNSTTVLKSDFKGLYQDQDFSDFRLKCEDVSFPVHRNILSARSPVFKTVFSCDMKEAASGCMDIVDLDARTLGLFLTYLYTGAVEDLQVESALKLYYAADKYQVTTLKRECVDFLSAKISVSNVGDILILADKHEDGELFSAVHDFILDNFDEVSSSEEWESFTKKEPLLAAKIPTNLSADGVGKIDLKSSESGQSSLLYSTWPILW